ncbi:PREDICTED: uncharacterized protein LOC109467481 [Branchiostoma belcheri]|uniref:Uncharacterized protein LOC109467481 n=1 Tax=Branchiostoma belcheri TaxID=7741 RepID=A0A6P4YGI6_BRABE|nr:PREDICTED: uncharacterized protein LOC109467481 [Branchiostoma belcheri]
MLIFLLSTLALVGAQHNHFDEHYNFGHLHQPIEQTIVFDCGSNPNRAIQNPKFTFNRNDLELPGTFIIQDFEIEITKPIPRPLYGRVEAWRTIWLLGGAGSTIQIGCFGLTSSSTVGLDSVGTCNYGDLCGILDLNTPINDTTGQPTCFNEAMNLGIPEDQCTCEGIIAPKIYSIPNWNNEVDLTDLEPGLLTFLAEGDYELKLIAEDDQGNEEACIGVLVSVKEWEDPNATGGWLFGKRR